MHVCGEDYPAVAETSCKGAPLARTSEDATLLVEWALTPRGDSACLIGERNCVSDPMRDTLLGDSIPTITATKSDRS